MSKPRFTPGPWKIFRATNGSLLGIGDAKAGGITDYQGGFWRWGKEKIANLHLVATAPELYAALADMIEKDRRRYGNDEAAQEHFRRNNAAALAALAKARGEESPA